MNNPICFALDGMSPPTAVEFIQQLEDHVGAFKVGLELFIRYGKLPNTRRPIVLDLKLHDIPETVASAVRAGGDMGAKFMTLHVQQKDALERAVIAAEPYGMTLLGVTVLTSMTQGDFYDLCLGEVWPLAWSATKRVTNLVEHGRKCGLKGFVCSPEDLERVREIDQSSFLLVPGIRPVGAELNDQKRVGTPSQAMKDGASLLVIGRPIRDAADPVAAAKSIFKEATGQ